MDIEQSIRNYLPQVKHMSLATSRDSRPWVCEVHFAYDDSLNLYFRSLTTRRHSIEIAANPHVAGNIVAQHPLHAVPLGVYFEGTADRVTDLAEINVAYDAMGSQLHVPAAVLDQYKDPDGPQFYRIVVATFYVFGKLDDSGVKKHELTWLASQK